MTAHEHWPEFIVEVATDDHRRRSHCQTCGALIEELSADVPWRLVEPPHVVRLARAARDEIEAEVER